MPNKAKRDGRATEAVALIRSTMGGPAGTAKIIDVEQHSPTRITLVLLNEERITVEVIDIQIPDGV